MVEIITHLHQYVPVSNYEERRSIPGCDEDVIVHKAKVHPIVFGGDQLTKVRAVSAIKIKSNGENPSTRLEGFIPTVEDWHTKLCLFEVRHQLYLHVNIIIIGGLEV